MNQVDRELIIGGVLTKLAEYFGKSLSETQLEMYVADLVDLDPITVAKAAEAYRRSPSSKGFPLPAALRSMLGMGNSPEDLARLASARIIEAVRRYGYTNPDRAKEHVGELGWFVVERQGGWVALCQSITSNDDIPILQAQWRELAAVAYRQSEAGVLDEAPKLPPARVLDFTNIAKQLPGAK